MGRVTQYSAINLISQAHVDPKKWSRMPFDEEVAKTIKAIEKRGVKVIQAESGQHALEILKTIIPLGATVMSGSSTTLIEIGYEDFIKKGQSKWNDLHDTILSENDDEKRYELRRKSVTADYFISGANAIAQSGEIIACDKSGSRVGAWPFAAGHLILVSGINKITSTLEDALQRVWQYAYPLEDARAKKVYGTPSQIGKCVILANEDIDGRVTLVLICESLGY
ncbi:MAG TPA: lactate utilization protein [Candidatus Acidoferrales bacterium]|nr:lactate utilization protein [Candidatus Acidoferrales bacterium]